MRHALALAGSTGSHFATPAHSASPLDRHCLPTNATLEVPTRPMASLPPQKRPWSAPNQEKAGLCVAHATAAPARESSPRAACTLRCTTNGIPDIDPRHQLMLHGLVDRPCAWTGSLQHPMVSKAHFLEAQATRLPTPRHLSRWISPGTFGREVSSRMDGNPLSLMDEARPNPAPNGDCRRSRSSAACHCKHSPDGMLALYQNGERLRPSNPMRLSVPGWEGNANVKWLH